jgi:hypothetical protein
MILKKKRKMRKKKEFEYKKENLKLVLKLMEWY